MVYELKAHGYISCLCSCKTPGLFLSAGGKIQNSNEALLDLGGGVSARGINNLNSNKNSGTSASALGKGYRNNQIPSNNNLNNNNGIRGNVNVKMWVFQDMKTIVELADLQDLHKTEIKSIELV